ncbi:MAG: peptidylprolyl isomerase, partial [Gammaproteobacteria bacterium]
MIRKTLFPLLLTLAPLAFAAEPNDELFVTLPVPVEAATASITVNAYTLSPDIAVTLADPTPTVAFNFSREDFDNPLVEIQTSLGSMILELFPDEAPLAVENFLALAKGSRPWIDPETGLEVIQPLYDGTI